MLSTEYRTDYKINHIVNCDQIREYITTHNEGTLDLLAKVEQCLFIHEGFTSTYLTGRVETTCKHM